MTELPPQHEARDMPRPRPFGKLGIRMGALIAAAMLPLGILSVIQTQNLREEANARSALSLMGQTVQAAAPLIRAIRDAEAVARTLSLSMSDLADDTPACRERMAAIQQAEPGYSLVAFVPLSGLMECSSTGQSFDFSVQPLFKQIAESEQPEFIVNRSGPVSGTSVLGITHPVRNAAGARAGFISISMPHSTLPATAEVRGPDGDIIEPVALITFDAEGQMLTSSVGLDDAELRLPADRTLKGLAADGMASFTEVSKAGFRRNYSVVPIADKLFLLGSWRTGDDNGLFSGVVAPYIFPSLMWLAGLVVAMLAAELLVIRYVKSLSWAMKAFSDGNRIPFDVDTASAPTEIRQLAWSYEDMIGIILRDEAELENLVRQKQVLLREVHHRTGNSLQLLASVIRMHLRQSPSDDVRELLTSLHDRVMSLATVHLGLYQTVDQPDVRMDELLTRVVSQMKAVAEQAGRKLDIQTEAEPIRLPPDQAVPLSLLLAELLSALSETVRSGADGARLNSASVILRHTDDDKALLRVITPPLSDPTAVIASRPVASQIGAQLVQGFAGQLGGKVSVERSETESSFQIIFPIREASQAI